MPAPQSGAGVAWTSKKSMPPQDRRESLPHCDQKFKNLRFPPEVFYSLK
ncbi:Hypothetical protein BSSP2_II0159 [Brucella suis bv. 2]|nr:Hypothetical protein BSSP3_II0159 [Brucella suis bv. 2]AIB32354.1 Hypothetical protein BSSP2_II0159 [Brucella suis bv. 2]